MRLASGRPRGMPMSATSTVPAWALPGLIHSPGLAAWKVTVTLACTAARRDLAGRRVDPARDVDAHHRARRRCRARRSRAPPRRGARPESRCRAARRRPAPASPAAAAGRAARPGARAGHRDRAARVRSTAPRRDPAAPGRAGARGWRGRPRSALRGRPRRRRRPPGRPRAASSPRRGRRRRCCPCRRGSSTGPSGAIRSATRVTAAPACSISSSPGTPRSSIAQRSMPRIVSASSSGSSQLGSSSTTADARWSAPLRRQPRRGRRYSTVTVLARLRG